jgi:hypothetical protein
VWTKVNDLLATGASYAIVLRALDDDNTTLEQRHRLTIDSIRNDANRHFPVQQVMSMQVLCFIDECVIPYQGVQQRGDRSGSASWSAPPPSTPGPDARTPDTVEGWKDVNATSIRWP